MPYLRHLSTSADLITAPEEIRAGFVALALERSRQVFPFVEQARALKVSAMQAKYLSTPRIEKHHPANRYQNSFEILHIMESFYAILGRFVLLIEAFLTLRRPKHAYSGINLFFVAHILYRC